ncbi:MULTISPECIES: hypothetical protein [Parabacteroides]|uniref:hypothetical protein n=1 Tax=Parabacteroides leei TaxID=2939491 RepID=UPI00189AE72D|nr:MULTISPECIES: hypothetical protein [Parabacteroides]MCL3852575.1 hypothetical protein [Parabacteroides leei]
METTTLKTFEISIPEKYVSAIRKLVKSMGGSITVRKEKKCGLDEALEDVKAGRVYSYSNVDEMWKDLIK